EDFDDASGTVYEAPAPPLPLLAIMQERGEEVRAKYYSEKTSISKVDKTLSDGGFTGYIELSENVLSGDYYLVYQAGKSMGVAYVGESGKLLQDDEAFETADDEVGIFKVRQVDIEPVEIPEPTSQPAGSGPADGGTDDGADDSGQSAPSTETAEESVASEPETADSGDRETDRRGGQTQVEQTPATDDDSAGTPTTEQGETATADRDSGPATDAESAANPAAVAERASETTPTENVGTAKTDTTDNSQTAAGRTEQSESEPRQDSTQQSRRGGTTQPDPGRGAQTNRRSQAEQSPRQQGTRSDSRAGKSQQSGGRQAPSTRNSRSGAATGSGDLETRSIPSIDPSNTSVPDDTSTARTSTQSAVVSSPEPDQSGGQGTAGQDPLQESHTQSQSSTQPATPRAQPTEQEPRPEQGAQQSPPVQESTRQTQPAEGEPPAADDGRLSELETELEQREETIDELETELDTATERREELEAELDAVRTERDELAEEVERLETEIERLEDELGAAADAERRLTADEALAGTDIFVRYRSKGKATLKKAHGASTRKDEVNENLRLEKHTQFDASAVSVGAQAYDEFLEGTLEFQFVRWVVRDLLFEVRETGHEKALGNLYDVLPLIDRAELSGVIEVTYTEDGQETQSQETFDVVLRDRMGHPLLAANLNDTREATTQAMMERLITSAERVGQANDDFSGAFLVTESFFDPGALEVTSQATQGGLLSRDKRKSFVNLSRKQGYHLCLVEARSENFHLAVPEL
ncbi:MAG: hypothetical protein V5A32_09160, partial [Halovenus sp.]